MCLKPFIVGVHACVQQIVKYCLASQAAYACVCVFFCVERELIVCMCTAYLQILSKASYAAYACVCVCVCVWRERERELIVCICLIQDILRLDVCARLHASVHVKSKSSYMCLKKHVALSNGAKL